MPEGKISWTNEKRKLSDLIPWPRNPRQIKSDQAKRLVESFDTFGQVETIAIGPNNEVYNGHQRLNVLASKYGKNYEVEVRVSDRALTEKEREKLTVFLHKGAAGEWDFDTLANEFELDDLLEWGFDRKELDLDLWAGDAPDDPGAQMDKAEELREKWGVESGQMWRLGEHRLICGDCTDRAVVERLKIPFGVYHAFWPSVDLDKQINFFLDRQAGALYPVADIERDLGYSQYELSSRTKYYMVGISSKRLAMIYTRASWWDYYINATWGGYYPLWVAHYAAKAPAIPIGWSSWVFWQYSADGNGQGAKYGAQSYSIDLNRYWGTLDDFNKEFNLTAQPPQPVPCATRFRVLVDVLNVRTGPGTNYPLVSGDNKLEAGEIVEAVNIAGANVWIEIAPGKFSAMKINSTLYMELAK